jgi:hypothetical protein
LEAEEEIFWVTLAHAPFSTAYNATFVDVSRFQAHFRRALQGWNYLCILEPAYYASIFSQAAVPFHCGVYWHVHGFAWGVRSSEIKARFKVLNRNGFFRPVVPSMSGAYSAQIGIEVVPDKMRYAVKSPTNAYRVGQFERVTHYGEILSRPKQKKSKLRPGERLRLFHLLKRLDLAALTIGGGAGRAVRLNALRKISTAHL